MYSRQQLSSLSTQIIGRHNKSKIDVMKESADAPCVLELLLTAHLRKGCSVGTLPLPHALNLLPNLTANALKKPLRKSAGVMCNILTTNN